MICASKMGEMMENIASFHDEEIARWVDWFLRLFEPLLMAFIGIALESEIRCQSDSVF